MRPNLKPLKIDGRWCCLDCRAPVGACPHRNSYASLRCRRCWVARKVAHGRVKGRAHSAVQLAVLNGLLLPVTMHRCVDCRTKPAVDYDHRDYTKPLEVDPVCRRCNLMRGHALGLPTPAQYLEGA